MAVKRITVAVGILLEQRTDGWWVFITRRSEGSVLGGFWEFPGGKVEEREAPADCVAREFMEELGLTVRVGAALPSIEYRYEHAQIRLHPFYCRHMAGQPQNLQVAEHRWVRVGELKLYQFPPANAALLKQVAEAWGRG